VPTHAALVFSQTAKFVQLFRQGTHALQNRSSLNSHQIFENCSIEYMIMIEILAYEESAEDFAQIGISRFVIKVTRMDIIEISCKFPWKTLAQIFRTDRLLHRQYKLLLLLLICGCKILS
jgi:hypothetical protein